MLADATANVPTVWVLLGYHWQHRVSSASSDSELFFTMVSHSTQYPFGNSNGHVDSSQNVPATSGPSGSVEKVGILGPYVRDLLANLNLHVQSSHLSKPNGVPPALGPSGVVDKARCKVPNLDLSLGIQSYQDRIMQYYIQYML